MRTTSDRADFAAGTAVSCSSTADSSGINGPFTEYDALMREHDALIYHRQMLERKKTELEQSLQKQRSEKAVCPVLFVFPSSDALLRTTCYDCVRRTFSTHGIAHQCVHNSAVLSSWSTPIGSGVGATGMNEYQKSFHAHYLTRTLRHAEKLYLRSANQDVAMNVLTTVHLAPMLSRLELDVPKLTEAMVQYISQWEAEGQLEYVALRLHQVTPALKLLCRLSSLRSLDLSYAPITDDDLNDLQGIQNLIKLNLIYCRGVTHLPPISHIKTLEVLKLTGCHQFVGVGALGRLPRLKELDLSKTAIKDEDIRLLSECHTLVKIDLQSCKDLTNVDPLSSIATLEVIYLSSCSSLTHVGGLSKLPALKEVDMSYTRITDDEARLLSECRTLVKIDLQSCKALTNVDPLSSIATLEVINLSSCSSLTHVGALGKLPALKEVDLIKTAITDDEARLLSESKALVKIDLSWCKALTNVNPLSSIATLEVINLSGCCSLAHVGALGKLPALKEVNLRRTLITDEEVRLLSESKALVKIDLSLCEALTNVNPLFFIATLEEINLSGCCSLAHVGALGKLPVLKEVNLRSTRITDEEVRLLSESKSLVRLNLNSCKALTNVNPLSSIETLEVITLSKCKSLTHVGDLGKLPVLKEVNLRRTRITAQEIRLLTSLREQLGLPYIDIRSDININSPRVRWCPIQ